MAKLYYGDALIRLRNAGANPMDIRGDASIIMRDRSNGEATPHRFGKVAVVGIATDFGAIHMDAAGWYDEGEVNDIVDKAEQREKEQRGMPMRDPQEPYTLRQTKDASCVFDSARDALDGSCRFEQHTTREISYDIEAQGMGFVVKLKQVERVNGQAISRFVGYLTTAINEGIEVDVGGVRFSYTVRGDAPRQASNSFKANAYCNALQRLVHHVARIEWRYRRDDPGIFDPIYEAYDEATKTLERFR